VFSLFVGHPVYSAVHKNGSLLLISLVITIYSKHLPMSITSHSRSQYYAHIAGKKTPAAVCISYQWRAWTVMTNCCTGCCEFSKLKFTVA